MKPATADRCETSQAAEAIAREPSKVVSSVYGLMA